MAVRPAAGRNSVQRHDRFQLFAPILNEDQLFRRHLSVWSCGHDESLAVWRNVVGHGEIRLEK